MNHNLYFIEILSKALLQRDIAKALRNAFEEIIALGSTEPYSQGFGQFQEFMEVVNTHHKKKQCNTLLAEYINELIIDVAAELYKGSDEEQQNILNMIKSRPLLRREYDKIRTEIQELTTPIKGFEIVVCCNDKIVESVPFTALPASKTINNVAPGVYRISFETGRIIWQGELTEKNLVWAKAYPGKPVKLAADTTQRKTESTKEFIIFDGEIMIRVFPGIECGRIVIMINNVGGST